MIYNEQSNTIIWLPYKNGSSSLVRYYNAHECESLTHEPTKWTCYTSNSLVSSVYGTHMNTRHGLTYPPDYRHISSYTYNEDRPSFDSYRRILPLRNPYDRVLSMWFFHIANVEHLGGNHWCDTLALFMRSVFIIDPITLPASRIFQLHFDEIVRVENIEEDLDKLGLLTSKPFPHVNKCKEKFKLSDSDAEDWESKWKPLIAHYHAEDFHRGGYEIEN